MQLRFSQLNFHSFSIVTFAVLLGGVFFFLACRQSSSDKEIKKSAEDQASRIMSAQSGLLEKKYGSPYPFGMVHADIADQEAGFVWVKTMTNNDGWDGNKVDTKAWHSQIDQRRKNGKIEVPLVVGETWNSGNLSKIKSMMRQFFEADPTVLFWELGIEENLKVRKTGKWANHWRKVAAKFLVVQEVKRKVNPDIRLGYQIAGLNLMPIKTFFASDAPKYVDILSLHPYRWPNFPTPEIWHDEWLNNVKQIMHDAGYNLPIWYTEVGAPINDENVEQMLAGRGTPITALTREEHARFIVKLHVMALNAGVEGVIWYNYKDRFEDPDNAEAHFGIVSYSGERKPSYYSYKNMVQCIGVKRPKGSKIISGGVRIYAFSDDKETCFVVWNYPEGNQLVKLGDIYPALANSSVKIKNLFGKEVAFKNNSIEITENPLFLKTNFSVKNYR